MSSTSEPVGTEPDCLLCRGPQGDAELHRREVWRDDLWRLTVSVESEVAGFSYLEPRRHIPHITDLDGDEAASLGPTLARTTSVLRTVTASELVYVYVFGGGIPHLHLHLAPHSEGDALNDQVVKGTVRSRKLPSGATEYWSDDYPVLPRDKLIDVAERVAAGMAAS